MNNMSLGDKRVRGFILAPVLLILAVAAFALGWPAALSVVLLILGAVMAVTGFLGKCPIYRVLGMSTCPLEHKTAAS